MKRLKFSSFWKSMAPGFLDLLIRSKAVRRWVLKRGERELFNTYVVKNEENLPQKVQEMRCYALVNLLTAVEKAIAEGRISPDVRRGIINNFVGKLVIQDNNPIEAYTEQYGHAPPAFITISPTKVCNLRCKGCYAGSSATAKDTLSYDVFSKILTEKKRDWGSFFTVISGGEPFMYKSGEKDIFDIFREHNDNYFMVYTNSTLINKETARKLAEVGNVAPAISVEGWEKETDARRGEGVFRKIQEAMDNLKEVGVPFGISITATKENADVILSDEFINYYFEEKGAIFGWIFQYMPIGRSYTVDLMVTPEQRKWMLERELDMIYKRRLFLVDFWNGGIMSVGCISAAKPGGYFYIDWNGNITPCVFFPYSTMNVNEVYARGSNLSEAINNEFFQSLRGWQEHYQNDGEYVGNMFRPCPIRDHHTVAQEVIEQYDPMPIDPDAAKALSDKEYQRRMVEYGEKIGELLEPMWLREVYGRSSAEESAKAVKERFLEKVETR